MIDEALPDVYEDEKLKPLRKVKHANIDEAPLLNSQKKELSRITCIGKGDKTDVARKHDRYLY